MATKRSARFHIKPLLFACITLGILGLAYFTYDRALPEGNTEGKPNIIIVMTDDQRYDSLDAMPSTLGRLGGRGVTFTNAYVTTPLCCPSRASFLTGKYAHNTGVWRNTPPEGGVGSFDDSSTLAVWLRNSGYTTALIGKYMNGYQNTTYIPPGWSEWQAFAKGNYYGYLMNDNGVLREYGYEPEDYSGTVVEAEAVDFIRDMRRSGDPFLLVITPNNPHGDSGQNSDEEADDTKNARPAPRHAESCAEITRYRPPNFNEEEIADKPGFVRAKKIFTSDEITAIDEFHKSQKCSLQAVDEMVEKIVRELGHMRENTAIIFTSDNGLAYGEHRSRSKNCLYEECIRVPLIISYPKLTNNPTISQSFVANIDITATIADLAGITTPEKLNGLSLLPLMNNQNEEIRPEILLEVYNDTTSRKDHAVRTKQYKYIERGNGERELYDLVQDPYELTNLSASADYQTIIADLTQKLTELKNE